MRLFRLTQSRKVVTILISVASPRASRLLKRYVENFVCTIQGSILTRPIQNPSLLFFKLTLFMSVIRRLVYSREFQAASMTGDNFLEFVDKIIRLSISSLTPQKVCTIIVRISCVPNISLNAVQLFKQVCVLVLCFQ